MIVALLRGFMIVALLRGFDRGVLCSPNILEIFLPIKTDLYGDGMLIIIRELLKLICDLDEYFDDRVTLHVWGK